nr:hypothetical protein [Streptomyces griseofuscus]
MVLESTSYPGTTRTVLGSVLEEVFGLRMGSQFALGFSPERRCRLLRALPAARLLRRLRPLGRLALHLAGSLLRLLPACRLRGLLCRGLSRAQIVEADARQAACATRAPDGRGGGARVRTGARCAELRAMERTPHPVGRTQWTPLAPGALRDGLR